MMRVLWFILAGLLLLFYLNSAVSAPVKLDVLSSVQVIQEQNETIVIINFRFPIAYKWHYPQFGSDILLVGIDAIIASDGEKPVLKSRESLLPLPEGPPYLQEITYDGKDIYGPYLLIEFEQSVNYKVQQGKDYRSIRIIIERPESMGKEATEITDPLDKSSEVNSEPSLLPSGEGRDEGIYKTTRYSIMIPSPQSSP